MDDPLRLAEATDTSTSRTRSFGGCGTCRARHIKCDETRPTCTTCEVYNLVCDGYHRRIFFDEEDDGKARYRQVLFTDEEREQMNGLMTKEVPFRRAIAVLTGIENECEAAESSAEIDIFRGPFGAFKLVTKELADQEVIHIPRTTSPFPDFANPESFQLPDWLETSSLFADYETQVSPMESPGPAQDYQLAAHRQGTDANSILNLSDTSILQDASLLLKHYANNYIPSLTPFRHTKTPWHILFLPKAKNTLASIAIGEQVDAANLTIFFGTLSISAQNLHHHTSGQKWSTHANDLKERAQENARIVLNHALDRPKRFKYKSIIMAMLTMAQTSMTDGSWDQIDHYLLEAEKIIRLRGLPKPSKSRKLRLLHHCYSYMRIFHESVSFSSTRLNLQRTIRDAVEKSGVIVRGTDPSSFRLIPWEDLDEKFREIKTREQGENDLLLAGPGKWPATMYPEIFGVPETWLNLLSQVIRLANEKETAESADEPTLSLKDFLRRAKALETYILRWEYSNNLVTTSSGLQIMEVDWIMLETMQSALHHALAIYFYRRIHDVDPVVLQPKVQKVKEYLFACKQICESGGGFLDGWMWPAFIAGCEALDPTLQEAFTAWFEFSTKKGH
ncbi:hypothetical protein OHC33_010938 [Knufia fluminis]|uniref:Zn(2)-C6 fungal-type domain-containing protein n=1 Tax=Knufia fluminis TaxID=191047 RepID=A0AAN8E915_9EURO|nr:hypothetical protein OHC33_010938 [Knufia fluminis]